MKVLLDECIDRRLAKEFVGYEVKTVPEMGWAGVKNGKLLALAESEFEVFVSVDRNLPFQQNLSQFDLAIVILQSPSNRLADLKSLVPNILAILSVAPKGQATIVSR